MLRGLHRSKELGWVDPLLSRLPLTPLVPGFLVNRTRSVPLALLLALPPAILYDASV
jgi:hypothetical protein